MIRAAAAVAVLALPAAGCGGPEEVHVVRPARPVWCPAEVKLRDRVVRQPGAFDARRLLGLSVDDAVRLGTANGCTVRVTNLRKDEVLTMDLRTDRVNVEAEHGKVARFDRHLGPIG